MVSADPFYGPIVSRIDNILSQYSAYVNENCKEWLVCNMYKNPAQFSPHSNFLSAELSRYANSYHFILPINMLDFLWNIDVMRIDVMRIYLHSFFRQRFIGTSKAGRIECSCSDIL